MYLGNTNKKKLNNHWFTSSTQPLIPPKNKRQVSICTQKYHQAIIMGNLYD